MTEKYKLSRLTIVSGIILCFCIIFNACQGVNESSTLNTGHTQEAEGLEQEPYSGTMVGALDLSGINIVTVQPGDVQYYPVGKIHVWHSDLDSYGNWLPGFSAHPIWTLNDINHSVAIGDLDGDNKKEIIVPGYCATNSGIGIFINAYEEGKYQYITGISDVWWTTYYEMSDWLYDQQYWSSEIYPVDLDNNGDSEVVLITPNQIAIFDYEPGAVDDRWKGEGTIKKIAQKNIGGLFDRSNLYGEIVSVNAGNITGDSKYPEIVLALNLLEEGEKQGYLVIFKDPELNNLEERKYYQAETGLSLIDGLQIGDVDGDESPEIWTLGVTYGDENVLNSKLTCWKLVEGDEAFWEENLILPFEVDVTATSSTLAVGDILDRHVGDEIAISSESPREINIYSPSSGPDGYSMGDPIKIPVDSDVIVDNVVIHRKKIVVGGSMQSDFSLYIGVIAKMDELINGIEYDFEWELKHGLDGEAWDIAVGP